MEKHTRHDFHQHGALKTIGTDARIRGQQMKTERTTLSDWATIFFFAVMVAVVAWVAWEVLGDLDQARATSANYKALCSSQARVIIRKDSQITSLTAANATLTADVARLKKQVLALKTQAAQQRTTEDAKAPAAQASSSSGWKTGEASWYGPGLYGGVTAHGDPFTPSTWCVAHLTYPFGTMLEIRYNGKTVKVPVLDRGPYISGRVLDLSGAVARALGFSGAHQVQYRVVSK